MKQQICNRTFEINTYLVNAQRKLGLLGLLNLLQDTAWVHATQLGHGYEEMIESGLIWVLTRQKLIVHSWPDWGQELVVRTWIRPIDGVFANRDFELYVKGEKIGECTTSWLTMDLKTRKPHRVDLEKNQFDFREDYRLPFDAPKIQIKNDLKPVTKFHVRNSDLDMNQHVNNTRYAQWVLDSVTLESHQRLSLLEYEINFLAETRPGDEVEILKEDLVFEGDQPAWVQFQGVRSADQKSVFSARLRVDHRTEHY